MATMKPKKPGVNIYPISITEPMPVTSDKFFKLPIKCRILILKYIGFKDQPTMRLVCSRFKSDIDTYIGVSIILRDTSISQTPNLPLRHAILFALKNSTPLSDFLTKPLLLKKITILGEVSREVFTYFVKNCPSLSNITIPFNRYLLKSKPVLFPIGGMESTDGKEVCKNLNILHLIGEPKKDEDVQYICDTIITMLTKTFANHPLVEIYIDFTLKTSSSAIMLTCLLTLSMYLFKNSQRLREFHLCIKESGTTLKLCENSVVNFVHDTESKLYNPYDDVDINSEFGSDILAVSSDDDDNANDKGGKSKNNKNGAEPATMIISPYHWKNLPRLKKVNIEVNSSIFKHFEGMLWRGLTMEELTLSIAIYNSWPIYCTILSSAVHTLTIVKLMNVNHANLRTGGSLDIELDVFSPCTVLKVLWLIGKKQEIFSTPNIGSIGALPKSLVEVEFGWTVISPWQFFRLIVCLPKLREVSLYYTNRSMSGFKKCLKVLRWGVRFGLTKITKMSIVDTKMRFQEGLAEREDLTNALEEKAECTFFDKGDVRLIVITKSQLNKK